MKKKKIEQIRPRNMVGYDLITNPLYRTRLEKTPEQRQRHLNDTWDRTRKHKGRRDHPADLVLLAA